MKKAVTALLILSMCMGLAGCGSSNNSTTAEKEESSEAEKASSGIDDTVEELKETFTVEDGFDVRGSGKKDISIYCYREGLGESINFIHSNSKVEKSWEDLKDDFEWASREMSERFPEYDITFYILDDEKTTVPVPNDPDDIYCFYAVSNGRCTYNEIDS